MISEPTRPPPPLHLHYSVSLLKRLAFVPRITGVWSELHEPGQNKARTSLNRASLIGNNSLGNSMSTTANSVRGSWSHYSPHRANLDTRRIRTTGRYCRYQPSNIIVTCDPLFNKVSHVCPLPFTLTIEYRPSSPSVRACIH